MTDHTRDDILRCLVNGDSPEQVARDHPPLTVADVNHILAHSGDMGAIARRKIKELKNLRRKSEINHSRFPRGRVNQYCR